MRITTILLYILHQLCSFRLSFSIRYGIQGQIEFHFTRCANCQIHQTLALDHVEGPGYTPRCGIKN